MKKYTKSEVKSLKIDAENKFKKFSNDILNEFLQYLEEGNSINDTFNKKEDLSYQLSNFIEINYPKTDEFFINEDMKYTVDTQIYVHLLINQFLPIRKKLSKLYQEHLLNVRDSNP